MKKDLNNDLSHILRLHRWSLSKNGAIWIISVTMNFSISYIHYLLSINHLIAFCIIQSCDCSWNWKISLFSISCVDAMFTSLSFLRFAKYFSFIKNLIRTHWHNFKVFWSFFFLVMCVILFFHGVFESLNVTTKNN